MKTPLTLSAIFFASAALTLAQARAPQTTAPPPPPPPPIFTAPGSQPAPAPQPQPASPAFVYDQKPVSGRQYLVTPDQAQTIINRFKETYPKLGNPRILIYVNRELVDEESGMKLSARSEQTEVTRADVRREFKADPNAPATPAAPSQPQVSGSVVLGNVTTSPLDNVPGNGTLTGHVERATNKNTYRIRDPKQMTVADRQTVRDVERLFGRPLRLGGATIVDQKVATQIMPGQVVKTLTVNTESEQARKDREALAKVADVVLEVLVSSRQISVPEVSGNKLYLVPDIQATAIRLSDSKIVGQATSADLLGDDRYAGRIARTFSVREVTEATALSLMEDMMQ